MQLAYSFDTKRFRLGSLCRRKHDYQTTGQSLRGIKGGDCIECKKINGAARAKTKPIPSPSAPCLSIQERRRIYKATYRQSLKNKGLTSRGTMPINAASGSEQSALNKSLRAVGKLPTVAYLVMQQQRQYWAENPKAKAKHDRQWGRLSWWLEYQIKPDLRLYHREKSKRRKAQDRGQTPVRVSVPALRQRFNDFSNCCAYCGLDGDMQIEHVVPISKGGAHDIGNIIPACMSCNFSKRSKPMVEWYKNQSFFSELRLKKIQNALKAPSADQLAFAIAYNH